MRPQYPEIGNTMKRQARTRTATIWLHTLMTIAMLGATCTTMTAKTQQLWTGSATFDDWSDVVNINGQKFANVSADDIVRFVMETRSGAQLQVSYGSGWTNFDGLEACNVSGDYDMVVTASMAKALKQGIHIKGVGYTLKAVEWISSKGGFESDHPALTWEHLKVCGGTKGTSNVVGLHRYGGMGWYIDEGLSPDEYETMEITTATPLKEDVIVTYTCSNGTHRRYTMKAGETAHTLSIARATAEVDCIAMMSAEAQTIVMEKITLQRKDDAIGENPTTLPECTAIYGIDGCRRRHAERGVNINIYISETGEINCTKRWHRGEQ